VFFRGESKRKYYFARIAEKKRKFLILFFQKSIKKIFKIQK
jgi:hypothetical protein